MLNKLVPYRANRLPCRLITQTEPSSSSTVDHEIVRASGVIRARLFYVQDEVFTSEGLQILGANLGVSDQNGLGPTRTETLDLPGNQRKVEQTKTSPNEVATTTDQKVRSSNLFGRAFVYATQGWNHF